MKIRRNNPTIYVYVPIHFGYHADTIVLNLKYTSIYDG